MQQGGLARSAGATNRQRDPKQEIRPLLSFLSVTVFSRRIFFGFPQKIILPWKFPDWVNHIRRSADSSAPTAAKRLQATRGTKAAVIVRGLDRPDRGRKPERERRTCECALLEVPSPHRGKMLYSRVTSPPCP